MAILYPEPIFTPLIAQVISYKILRITTECYSSLTSYCLIAQVIKSSGSPLMAYFHSSSDLNSVLDSKPYGYIVLLPPTIKLGQGNIFTGVCDSVHRGGLPQCMLGYHTPRTRHPPPDQAGTPLPSGAEHTGRYGQQAGGMHPTGMQSCAVHVSTDSDSDSDLFPIS